MKPLVLIFCILSSSMAVKAQQYSNPVLGGFYPDPSLIRVNGDYYLVNSSFSYFPGLPVFHSRDLVSWHQIGNAMDRPEQLDLQGAGVSRGLFAPTIRYYKGLFYIVCTLIDKGGNFVITARDPKGPWSNPHWLKNVNGIDPSLYFDENEDKAYIVYNSNPPGDKPLWSGHRSIRIRSFDYINLKAGDDEKILINGGTDISKKPVWIEGPHIYRINGRYYLLCAEGGTSENHSEVVFRSAHVDGPYESYSGNPVLTQRQLDPARKNPITSTGHAEMVQTSDGRWYAVFLGCRPYAEDHYNTGRETFLAPVRWKEGWPVITEGREEVRYFYPLPQPAISRHPVNVYSGNLHYRTDFTARSLDPRFIFLRTVTQPWYSLTDKKGWLGVQLRPETVSGTDNPSFVGFRQQNTQCIASTFLQFDAQTENEKAGLIIFQNEHHFYFLCRSSSHGRPEVRLYRSTTGEDMELLRSQPLPSHRPGIYLRIESKGSSYSFAWSEDNRKWNTLSESEDGRFLSTKTAGGFVGCVFGLYATSTGEPCSSSAFYDWFDYRGKDDLYPTK